MSALPVQRCMFEGCAKEYQARREWQKFCSTKCRMEFANGRRSEALKLLGRMERAPTGLELHAGARMVDPPELPPVLRVATQTALSASGAST